MVDVNGVDMIHGTFCKANIKIAAWASASSDTQRTFVDANDIIVFIEDHLYGCETYFTEAMILHPSKGLLFVKLCEAKESFECIK